MSATSSLTDRAPGMSQSSTSPPTIRAPAAPRLFAYSKASPRAAPVIRMTFPVTLIVRSLAYGADDAAGCREAQSRGRTGAKSEGLWSMAPNTKRVFYVNALSHPVYLEILAKRPDIQVDKLVN